MSAAALLLVLAIPSASAPDTLVVCPAPFQAAFAPWISFRQQQGHVIAETSATSPGAIREAILDANAGGRLKFVVLVGDAAPDTDDVQPDLLTDPAPIVPASLVKARVIQNWGDETEIATDNAYADLDDDGVPDLAVGRLTADSPQELAAIVQKTILYETATGYGPWRSRVNFVAGEGGFGGLADAVLETIIKALIAQGVPAAYTTSMTSANWRSPYCPGPPAFQQAVVDRFSEGCAYWVYMGHGQRWFLRTVQPPGHEYPAFDTRDIARIDCGQHPPIAFFLACYTGAFDGPYDCMAEELLRSERGPVAVVGASRVTMPYAMAVLGDELFQECFGEQRATLGELLLHAKRNMLLKAVHEPLREMLDATAASLNPAGTDLAQERRDHVNLFNLVGDPLLRLRRPGLVELHSPATVAPGGQLVLKGRSQVSGKCTVELTPLRGELGFTAPLRRRYSASPSALASYAPIYDQANRPLATAVASVEGGEFSAVVNVPDNVTGPCYIRVFVEGEQACAAGAAEIQIGPSSQ